MNHRKFEADQIFTGREFLDNDHILITTDTGEIIGIEKQTDAGENIETLKGIITPGFINAHCHLELSHMEGMIPEKTGLVDFVFKVVSERHFPDEEILIAIAKAEDQMLQSGIVAVGDICNNLSTYTQKSKKKLAYYNFIESSGWPPAVSEIRFERSLKFYNEFLNLTTNNQPQSSIVPHAPYSVSENLWSLITPYFKNKVVSIHNQETAFEDEFFLKGTGDFIRMYQKMNIDNSFHIPAKKSSLQSHFSKLSSAKSIILVHNTFTGQADLDFVNAHKTNDQLVSFCLCINANQYIENAIPPVQLLKKNNCNIVVGTDSLAGNQSLNILDELKTIQNKFPLISLKEMLQWATINGATALQMNDKLGSFEKGKSPGIVLIENVNGYDISKASSKRIL